MKNFEAPETEWILTLVQVPFSLVNPAGIRTLLSRYEIFIESRLEFHWGAHWILRSESEHRSRSTHLQGLRTELYEYLSPLKIDFALQARRVFNTPKKLACFDMDSTLIQNETIDELAREAGTFEEVARITQEAMEGKLEFSESLKKRAATLKGLESTKIMNVLSRINLSQGAKELCEALERNSITISIMSGGFSFVADKLQKDLGIDFSYTNNLISKDSHLTGEVAEPIIDSKAKAAHARELSQKLSLNPHEVMAVGDGANDRLMCESVGLALGFHPKPALRASLHGMINFHSLEWIKVFSGFSDQNEPLNL